MDSYPVSPSNLMMDTCGRGVFPGKGVYDVKAFQHAAAKLPDNAILSHDLIEGLLAGAGLATDVAVFDDFPPTLAGYLRRLERWTRGDWQLVRFIKMAPDPLGKWMLLSNLMRSLAPGAALLTLIIGLWSGTPLRCLPASRTRFCRAAPPVVGIDPPARRRNWRSCRPGGVHALRRRPGAQPAVPHRSRTSRMGARRRRRRQFGARPQRHRRPDRRAF
jgi:hypothetical protein